MMTILSLDDKYRLFIIKINLLIIKGESKNRCRYRDGKMLDPKIFALVTCRDCYIFMPNTQFKPRKSSLITSETNGSSSSDKGKNECSEGAYLEMFI